MDRYFNIDMPAGQFAWHTLIATVLGLVPLLVLYVALTPGFASHLVGGGPALVRFLRQVVTNGLPVVFAVNYAGFLLFALTAAGRKRVGTKYRLFFVDLILRVTLFIALHAVIYALSADLFGSFGGDRFTALRVVAPTLAQAALFENVSGVYLYATLVSALPLYAAIVDQAGVPKLRSMPYRLGLLLAAVALFCLFVVFLTLAAGLIVRIQTS